MPWPASYLGVTILPVLGRADRQDADRRDVGAAGCGDARSKRNRNDIGGQAIPAAIPAPPGTGGTRPAGVVMALQKEVGSVRSWAASPGGALDLARQLSRQQPAG